MATTAPATTTLPAPGWLQLGVLPWADVSIDGALFGQTPLGRIALSPGTHDVVLTHPDYQPYRRRIRVRSADTVKLVVDLSQDGVRKRP